MAVPKCTAEFLGLRDIDVLPGISQETAADYFNIYECPEILTQGKSSFLIGGSPELKPGVDIKIELIINTLSKTHLNSSKCLMKLIFL